MDLMNLVAKLTLDSSQYDSALDKAQGSASTFGGKLKSGLATAAKVTTAAIGATTTAAIAFGKSSVNAGMQFDASMSRVAATMGVTVDEIEELRKFALEMGSTTTFSATQAAEALNYMALAGYDADTSMAMLPNVLNLAAAGGMDLATASDMITDAQSALNLKLDETSVMVDQMAKAASRSNTSVSQLGDAILTIGGTATMMSGGTDRLATVLGIMADNGIKGSEAGTHLRNMLLKLSSPTKDGATAMEQLGLQVFDSSGQMRDMQDIISDLNVAFSGMTDEQKIKYISDMFNSRDIAAVNALLNTTEERWNELGNEIVNSGSAATISQSQMKEMVGTLLDGFDKMGKDATKFNSKMKAKLQFEYNLSDAAAEEVIARFRDNMEKGVTDADALAEALKDVGGSAKAMAETQLGNLSGDMTLFRSALEGAQIAMSDQLTPTLREFVQFGSESVSTLTKAFQEDGVGGAMEAMGTILANGVSMITEKLPEVVDAGITLFQALLSGITDNLHLIVPAVVEIALALGTAFLENLPLLVDAGIQIVLGLMQGFIEAFPQIVPVLIDSLNQIVDVLIDNIDILIQGIIDIVFVLGAHLPEILGALWKIVVKLWDSWVQPALDAVGDFFVGIWEGIKNVFGSVGAWFDEHVIQPVVGFFSGMWEGLKKGASNAWEGVKNVFSAVGNWFKETFQKAWQKVKDVFSAGGKVFEGIKEGIEKTFKTVVNAIIRGINKVIKVPFDTINWVLGKIKAVEILGFKPFDWINLFTVPQIPELARGGVLKRGQIGLLEGTGAEAVVPLENNDSWIHAVAQDFAKEMGQGITVYMTVNANPEDDVDSLAEKISEKLAELTGMRRAVYA